MLEEEDLAQPRRGWAAAALAAGRGCPPAGRSAEDHALDNGVAVVV